MTDTHAIIAPYRIQFEYVISTLVHRIHVYVKDAQLIGGGYFLLRRTDNNFGLIWENCATHYGQLIATAAYSGISMGPALLQHRNGTVWETVSTTTPTITPNVGVSFTTPGSQLTTTFRDTNLNRFKLTLMEVNEAAPQKFVNPTAGSSAMDAFIADVMTENANDFQPWKWLTSKYGLYPQSGGFVGCVVDLNRKTLRARGLK